ncbi:MAG: Rpn family recombination-promoting nuclease/putative transposase [Magnetococcales bacterium]|nr:Rpn family recombination-promoting nuclease/putative transposase [Magnetococcales bacterium]
MADITHPHDRFLKILLSNPMTAGTLLRERLPKEIAECLSLEPPSLVDGTFIDGEFRQHLTDRLFRVKTVAGGEAYVYALVEHKSHPDDWIAFQLLRYMVQIWERMGEETGRGGRLSPIVPLLVYHGRQAWQIPPLFSALVDAETSWQGHLLDFRFSVVDLGQIDDTALSRDDRLRGGFLALKCVFQKGVKPETVAGIGKVLQVDQELAKQTLLYLIQTYEELDMDSIQAFSDEAFPGKAEEYKSLFAREMIAKGRQEGRQEGESKILHRQLQRKFGPSLPDWVEDKLATASLGEIEEWSDQILDAQSLDEVFV